MRQILENDTRKTIHNLSDDDMKKIYFKEKLGLDYDELLSNIDCLK